MNTQLATVAPEVNAAAFMPLMDVDDILKRHSALLQFRDQVLREGVDFGAIPGTGNKPVLLKPGAEKLCTLFGLTVCFETIEKIEDWSGEQHGGEPFFYYYYRCSLLRGAQLIAQSDGSCNSWESKYRWRKSERVCPDCGNATIITGKKEYGGGFICFAKKGGCGAKFSANDPSITEQIVGRTANTDVADVVNTIQKMAQKRALVAATLVGVNASEFFTQDIEDFSHGYYHEESAPVSNDAVIQSMRADYAALLEEGAALGISRKELPPNAHEDVIQKYIIGLKKAIDRKQGASEASPAPTTLSEAVAAKREAASVSSDPAGEAVFDAEIEEEPAAVQTPAPGESEGDAPKESKALKAFFAAANEKVLSDDRDKRIDAVNQWLLDSRKDAVESITDVPDVLLVAMRADIKTGKLTW
jgi:hypothetical protein